MKWRVSNGKCLRRLIHSVVSAQIVVGIELVIEDIMLTFERPSFLDEVRIILIRLTKNMNQIDSIVLDLLLIISQVWWPVNIYHHTKKHNDISYSLIRYHDWKLKNINEEGLSFYEEYNVSDIFSLYFCIKFIIEDLWEEEYFTVTWKDLCIHWYATLAKLKSVLIKSE